MEDTGLTKPTRFGNAGVDSTGQTLAALELGHLSVKTVESHRQSIKRKLNLGTATQLMRCAMLDLARRDA